RIPPLAPEHSMRGHRVRRRGVMCHPLCRTSRSGATSGLALQSYNPYRVTAYTGGPMSHGGTDRRRFLKRAGLAALAASAGAHVWSSWSEQAAPYSSGTEAPKLQAPPDACDCHMHIYNGRYPVAPTATLRPPDANVADYRLLQKRIRTSRNVVVQPSTY